MIDYEIGFGYDNGRLKSNLNFYLMDFKNEIVSNGQLDNVGQPIAGNAGKSIHRGIEIEAEYNLLNSVNHDVTISGNINLSENYFNEYREILGSDSSGNIIYGNDYSGNKILLNPGIIGNIILNYKNSIGISGYAGLQYIGKQYLDNSENERKNPSIRNQPGYVDKVISPYSVLNAGVNFNLNKILKTSYFNKLELSFRGNNLLNRLYETYGSVDGAGTSYLISAATRNFYLDITFGL